MALFLARHGQRHDYEQKRQGVNWTATAERPWDPPLTAHGEEQGALLGCKGRQPVADALTLGCIPVTFVASGEASCTARAPTPRAPRRRRRGSASGGC